MKKILILLIITTLFMVAFNWFQMNSVKEISIADVASNTVSDTSGAGDSFGLIPKGMPNIYGNELGVSFDDVSPANLQKADSTIKKLGVLDQQINLKGGELKRYIGITSKISCEYCCGADSIIFGDGRPACGCQHSFAMRGLAKYLIKNHANEYTDDQILEELGKWKMLFFPSQLLEKAKVLQSKGIELNYINLASNKYRGL